MLTRLVIIPSLLAVVLSAGCRGLTPGEMDWVKPTSTAPRAGNVYLLRGLIGVFSTGMDDLGTKLSAAGVSAHVFQDDQHTRLADAIIRQYQSARDPEPLVLIGHSYGADDVLRIAHTLKAHHIPVDMVVTVDATTPPTVPENVRACYNYFQSQFTDIIPMFRGIPLKLETADSGILANMNVRTNRKDLLEPGTNHINSDKNPRVHEDIVERVLDVCPPRETWAAGHRPLVQPGAIQARAVVPPPQQAQRQVSAAANRQTN
jgi:pimeloyl-ACP methyl ester carboxylesterase